MGTEKTNRRNVLLRMFFVLATGLIATGRNEKTAHRMAWTQTFGGGTNPIFIPRKHTNMNYRQQQRAALKRRRVK